MNNNDPFIAYFRKDRADLLGCGFLTRHYVNAHHSIFRFEKIEFEPVEYPLLGDCYYYLRGDTALKFNNGKTIKEIVFKLRHNFTCYLPHNEVLKNYNFEGLTIKKIASPKGLHG